VQVKSIVTNPVFGSNTCAQCQALLEVLKFVSLAAPERGPDLVVVLCGTLKLFSTCEATFGRQGSGLGAVITQVVANADIGGYDGQVGDQHFPGDSLACIACRPYVKISFTRAPPLRLLP
jgi:sphingomyelin phosphodiesterase